MLCPFACGALQELKCRLSPLLHTCRGATGRLCPSGWHTGTSFTIHYVPGTLPITGCSSMGLLLTSCCCSQSGCSNLTDRPKPPSLSTFFRKGIFFFLSPPSFFFYHHQNIFTKHPHLCPHYKSGWGDSGPQPRSGPRLDSSGMWGILYWLPQLQPRE